MGGKWKRLRVADLCPGLDCFLDEELALGQVVGHAGR